METAMMFPALLLQKPHHKSKSKDHVNFLDRRLNYWFAGDIQSLLHEGHFIHSSLHYTRRHNNDIASVLKSFARLVSHAGQHQSCEFLGQAQLHNFL